MNGNRMNQSVAPTSFITSISWFPDVGKVGGRKERVREERGRQAVVNLLACGRSLTYSIYYILILYNIYYILYIIVLYISIKLYKY